MFGFLLNKNCTHVQLGLIKYKKLSLYFSYILIEIFQIVVANFIK